MPSAISLVTLLTDFGNRDYFVPSMKGVMLGINPQLRIIDLSHQIAPQNIEQASFFLKSFDVGIDNPDQLVDQLRGKPVGEALTILNYSRKLVARPLEKSGYGSYLMRLLSERE